MGRRATGKSKSELVLEYQDRLLRSGLVRITAWVPPAGREEIKQLARQLRQKSGVLLPYEAKATQAPKPARPKRPPRAERKTETQRQQVTSAPTAPASPLVERLGKLPGLP